MTLTTLTEATKDAAKEHGGWIALLVVIAGGLFNHIDSVDRRKEIQLQFELQKKQIVATSNAVVVAEAKAEVANTIVSNVAVKVENNTVAVTAQRIVNVEMAGHALVEKAESQAVEQVNNQKESK